jgi:hypothetical protein
MHPHCRGLSPLRSTSHLWPCAARNRGSAFSAMIDKPEPRRFPPPWIAEETDACFIVRDANGQVLAYKPVPREEGDAEYNQCGTHTAYCS